MSDLDEKLARSVVSTPGRARASIKHLRARWGELKVLAGTEREPQILQIKSMGPPERWRSTGRDADGLLWYEMEP